MRKYAWPGNIRQLENRIKKALVLCDQTLLAAEDLDLGPEAQQPHPAARKGQRGFPARYMLEVLERNNGNRTQTARELGVDPRTIFRYLEKEPHPMPERLRRASRSERASTLTLAALSRRDASSGGDQRARRSPRSR